MPGVDYPGPPAGWRDSEFLFSDSEKERAWNAFVGRPISRAEAGALREVNVSRGSRREARDKRSLAATGMSFQMETGMAPRLASDFSWSASQSMEDCESSLSINSGTSSSALSVTTMLTEYRQPMANALYDTEQLGAGQGSTALFSREEIVPTSRKPSTITQRLLSSAQTHNRPRQRKKQGLTRTRTREDARGQHYSEGCVQYDALLEGGFPSFTEPDIRGLREGPRVRDCDGDTSIAMSTHAKTPRSEISLEEHPEDSSGKRSGGPTAMSSVGVVGPSSVLGIGGSAFHLLGEADADDVLRAMMRLSKPIEVKTCTANKSDRQLHDPFITALRKRSYVRGPERAVTSGGAVKRKWGGGLSRGSTPAVKSGLPRQLPDVASDFVEVSKLLGIERKRLRSEERMSGRQSQQKGRGAHGVERSTSAAIREHPEKSTQGGWPNGLVDGKELIISESHSAPAGGQGRSIRRISPGSLTQHLSSFGLTQTPSYFSASSTTSRLASSLPTTSVSNSDSQLLGEQNTHNGQRIPFRCVPTSEKPDQHRQSKTSEVKKSITMPIGRRPSNSEGNDRRVQSKANENRKSSSADFSSAKRSSMFVPGEDNTTIDDGHGSDADDNTTGEEMSVIIAGVTKNMASVLTGGGGTGRLPFSMEGIHSTSPEEVSRVSDPKDSLQTSQLPPSTHPSSIHAVGSAPTVAVENKQKYQGAMQSETDASEKHERQKHSTGVGAEESHRRGEAKSTSSKVSLTSGGAEVTLNLPRRTRGHEKEVRESIPGHSMRESWENDKARLEELIPPSESSVFNVPAICQGDSKLSTGGNTLEVHGSEDQKNISSIRAADGGNTHFGASPAVMAHDIGEKKAKKRNLRKKKQPLRGIPNRIETRENTLSSQRSISSCSTKSSVESKKSSCGSKQSQTGKSDGLSDGQSDQPYGQEKSGQIQSLKAEKLPHLAKEEVTIGQRSGVQQQSLPSRETKHAENRAAAEGLGGGSGIGVLPPVGGVWAGGMRRQSRSGAPQKKGGGGHAHELKVHIRPTRVESDDLQTTTEALTMHHLGIEDLLKVRQVDGQ